MMICIQVRDTALSTVLSLYERGELATIIEEYSVMYLRFGLVISKINNF
jgi:hypothetical protein